MKNVKVVTYKNLPNYVKQIFRFYRHWLYVIEHDDQIYAGRVYPLTIGNFVRFLKDVIGK